MMQIYYKDQNNSVHAFDSDATQEFIDDQVQKRGLVAQINESEALAIVNPPLSIYDFMKQKSVDIDSKAQAFIDEQIPSYPEFEKLTFERQEREARAYLADDTVSTPTLSPIAIERGLTVLEIANRVVAKADAFNALAASVAGQRQSYHDQLTNAYSAQDRDAIAAIDPVYQVPA